MTVFLSFPCSRDIFCSYLSRVPKIMGNEPIRVLLVEDNEFDSRVVQRLLKRVGERDVRIEWLADYEAAEHRIRLDDVDIYLIDYRLAAENGIELVRQISKRESKIPVILMTGQGDPTTDVDAMHAGADDYLIKGEFSAEMLERSVRYAMEHKRIERELAMYQQHLEQLVDTRTQELMKSEEKRAQAERLASLGALSAGIAHEINNPIGAIMLIAQNALEAKDEPGIRERLERTCQKIILHAERCGEIVRGILRFARQEPTEKLPHDVNQIIRHGVELIARTLRLNGSPKMNLADNLALVPVNRFEIEQVIANLLRNAVEAGSTWTDISVETAELAGGGIQIVLSDRGRGIPREALPHIFDPFFTTRIDEGGTGLGLSIVHGIIAAHGGTISVESEPRKGTSFTLNLPGADAPPATNGG